MAFQVSPGVQVTEKDLTNVVPAVATSIAGIVMAAEKGPTDTVTAIASEEELVSIFGAPLSTSNQFEDWMSAAAFLGYGNALRVVRPASGAVNARTTGTALLIKKNDHYKDGDGSTGPYNDGSANMVDISSKKISKREAIASSEIIFNNETYLMIKDNQMTKGNVINIAQLAGITAS